MRPFVITGLPRSRTAWWSVATTTPISVCAHEPVKHCHSFDDLKRWWDRPSFAYVGVSDSSLAAQLGRVLAEISPRTLMIERDAEDVERSCRAYFAEVPLDGAMLHHIIGESAAHLAKWRNHPLVKRVRFEDLNDLGTVEDCLDWLMPENRPEFRRELMHMNIQVELSYALDQMRKPNSHWYRS